jgi:hypothetical protein
MRDGSGSKPRLILLLAAALAMLIGLALWLVLRGDKVATAVAGSTSEQPVIEPSAAPRPRVVSPRAPADAGSAGARGGEEVPVRDPGPDDDHDGAVHPHPITAQHERIFRENQLIGALNGAMDVNDGPGLRKLLQQYQQEYPDDPSALQQGYELIADCLEHPGAAARATAQRYYDTERGSTLRRFVARHCLEP